VKKLLLTAWDRMSLYLPIMLMALLALVTYWLVQSAPTVKAPAVKAPVRSEPDYFMKKFSVKSFGADGRLQSEVIGAVARHYPDLDTVEIDDVRIRLFDTKGRLTTASANRALSNADSSEVQLFGNAQVVREAQVDKSGRTSARIEFRSEFLHAYLDSERVTSNLPVELRRGQDVFSADGMEFDNPNQFLTMQGRVRGTLVPVAGK